MSNHLPLPEEVEEKIEACFAYGEKKVFAANAHMRQEALSRFLRGNDPQPLAFYTVVVWLEAAYRTRHSLGSCWWEILSYYNELFRASSEAETEDTAEASIAEAYAEVLRLQKSADVAERLAADDRLIEAVRRHKREVLGEVDKFEGLDRHRPIHAHSERKFDPVS